MVRNYGLTPRELVVLKYFADGWTSPEIAAELHFSTETIKTHSKHMKQKLSAKNIPHAVAIAIRIGIIG